MIKIEEKGGVTIYGRIVDNKCKLGKYEVHSDILGFDGIVYSLLSDAQNKMKKLIGVYSK